MRFTPKTPEELKTMGLIEEGEYPFEVLEAEEQLSKKGNEMIKLKLKIWDNNGRERTVFDYIMEAMAFKLIHFCDYTGLKDKYEAGSLTADACIGRSGRLHLVVEPGSEKQTGGKYDDKNSVKDYLDASVPASKPGPVANGIEPGFDDDLPF